MESGPLVNVLACEGKPGEVRYHVTNKYYYYDFLHSKVLEVKAKIRTGEENFITCMRKALAAKYGEKPVALGGVFNIVKGTAKLHVMASILYN